jgi:beta-lactamase class A
LSLDDNFAVQPLRGTDADAAVDRIVATLAAAGARGWLHARPVQQLDPSAEVGIGADAPVLAASVIKILFAVAFARAVVAGTLDPTERVEVPGELRIGGSGSAGFADPPVISLRDLALSMMTVSDNAATDLIFARVGREAVEQVIGDLGLAGTHVRHDMLGGARHAAAQLNLPGLDDLDARLAGADPDAVRALAWLDPAHGNAVTARDMTTLLAAVWTDQVASPSACAMVRRMMAQQQNTQRLASGFKDEVTVAAKTGTLPTVRNEAGVVVFPDGQAYAVAVFTRSAHLADRDAALDAAIGQVAATAVATLRG